MQAHARFSPVAQLGASTWVAPPTPVAIVELLPPSDLTSAANGASDADHRNQRRCDMAIENRDLPAGTRLVAVYKGKSVTCTVEEDESGKRVFVVEGGGKFASPSAAGSAVMGGIACNGWRFWSVGGTVSAKSAPRSGADKGGKLPATLE